MRKLFFLVLAAATLTVISCKRDYVCECNFPVDGEMENVTAYFSYTNKSHAQGQCEKIEQDLVLDNRNDYCILYATN
jgi:hypothetical protein